jgi:hypothetical protein
MSNQPALWTPDLYTVEFFPHAGTVETQKPRNTHAPTEVRVFIGRCWVTPRSLLLNAEVNTSLPFSRQAALKERVFAARCKTTGSSKINQRRDRCYAIIGTHVSTIEGEFSVCDRRGGYVTSQYESSSWQFTSVQFSSVQFSSLQLTIRSPQLRTSRRVTSLCVISCEANNCSSAKERPNQQGDK